MGQFSFEYPLALLVLLLFIACSLWCREKTRTIFFPHVKTLIAKDTNRISILSLLKWAAIILAVVALASPILTKNYVNIKKEGRDIVLVIDSSKSMQKTGFSPKDSNKSKFDVVKEIVSDFVKKRKNDRIGMVTFADTAFIASPLTFEKGFLSRIVEMQRLGLAGRHTAINDALVQSYTLMSKSDAKSKVVILLTDGKDNMSKVPFPDVKQMIEKRDIKLYTIGIGGTKDFDAKYLKALAKAGKGRAYAARSAAMLSNVYDDINKLEASKLDHKKIVEHTRLFVYPLFLAILSLLMYIYYKHLKGA